MTATKAYAAYNATEQLKPYEFNRRELGPTDVKIDIAFCGVCHSDIHTVRDEWGGANYPLVPGHEIVGHISAIGKDVTGFKVGDVVGVGCLVDSCQQCPECQQDLEQFCPEKILTYNSTHPKTGEITQGGYANNIVVDEKFVLHVPANLPLNEVGPLLCAGITTYSPLRHWQVSAGDHVGVVGLGGLGHMAVKLAKAMGAHVVVFTTSPNKKEDALRLGADAVVISKNADEFTNYANSLNLIINTVSVPHDLDPYLSTLKRDGTMVFVGLPSEKHPAPTLGNLIFYRRSMAGSIIGGIKETQDMLDFCGEHNITADVEMIDIANINTAYERVIKSDVKYRFVIDMSSL